MARWGCRQALRVLLAVAVLSVPACSKSSDADSSGSGASSSNEFCQVLEDALESMDENASSSGGEVAEQLALLATNLSETNGMIRRLREVAPSQIDQRATPRQLVPLGEVATELRSHALPTRPLVARARLSIARVRPGAGLGCDRAPGPADARAA